MGSKSQKPLRLAMQESNSGYTDTFYSPLLHGKSIDRLFDFSMEVIYLNATNSVVKCLESCLMYP